MNDLKILFLLYIFTSEISFDLFFCKSFFKLYFILILIKNYCFLLNFVEVSPLLIVFVVRAVTNIALFPSFCSFMSFLLENRGP